MHCRRLAWLVIVAAVFTPVGRAHAWRPDDTRINATRDSDGDGLSDAREDRDDDGVVDANETDPTHADTDGDGQVDGVDLAPLHLEIPEPMVFDLVRGLGSRRGEVELNTLVLSGRDGQASTLRYAPELEVAIFDGLGVELELPMEGEHVESVKGAVQGRLGQHHDGRWMHGIQVIGEYLLDHRAPDAHLLWLVSGLVTPQLAAVAMVGGRISFIERMQGQAIVNVAGYHAVRRDVWVGAETNLRWDPHGREFSVRAMFQTHVSIQAAFRMQLGLGVEHTAGTSVPVAGARFIIEL